MGARDHLQAQLSACQCELNNLNQQLNAKAEVWMASGWVMLIYAAKILPCYSSFPKVSGSFPLSALLL